MSRKGIFDQHLQPLARLCHISSYNETQILILVSYNHPLDSPQSDEHISVFSNMSLSRWNLKLRKYKFR